ncbi:unnamed protein product [Tuber melanosporum]|uniref:(Perigord truffle) hypothetical protein n=1 Tax=Tuber melanosporum (strain Mel28) TaxID=656061 RepID=D5GJG1_TUBMM|nr:uncharacterized protein GSTUM_00008985001 [Tuber melanosporum]CAZ84654.1 unnamed protein product [Tuber melanosporum]
MPAFGGPVLSDLEPTPTAEASVLGEAPATQTEDPGGWHPGETSPPNGRSRPHEETLIQITPTTAGTLATPTEVPAVTATESGTPVNPASRVSTGTLVGILVALGVVSVAALIALACLKRKKRRRSRRRSPIDGEDEAEKAPPSYEAAVFGSTDNATWNEHYGINNPPQQPEQPILQSPEPVHHVIHSPRPISAASSTALNRLEPVVTPQQRPVSQEIVVFPHDSPVLGPQDDNISLQAALRLSQQSNRVLYSQPTASGRFTENFDDSASVVSELTEEERIVAVEIV